MVIIVSLYRFLTGFHFYMSKTRITPNLPEIPDTQGRKLPDKKYQPKYIPIEDLIEYSNKGLSGGEIAAIVGCSVTNVNARLKDADLKGLDRFRKNKDKVFEHKQREIVQSLSGHKLKGMSGLQLITGAAILEDKIRAIRGQATEVVDHRVLVADISAVMARLQSLGVNLPQIDDNKMGMVSHFDPDNGV